MVGGMEESVRSESICGMGPGLERDAQVRDQLSGYDPLRQLVGR